jgi:hypothetical protein
MPVFDEEITPVQPQIRSAVAIKRQTSILHWLALAASLTAFLFA